MISIVWTYLWTGFAGISFFVRFLVLRGNLRDARLIRMPTVKATPIMRSIARSHLLISTALAFISISNTIVGLSGLWLHYHPSLDLSIIVGYFFIGYFLTSEVVLTLLAWTQLRVRNHGASTAD